MTRLQPYLLIFVLLSFPIMAATRYVDIPGGSFRSALTQDGNARETVTVAPFRMRTKLVSNAEFLAFVRRAPSWQRDRIATVYANRDYLSYWAAPLTLGAGVNPRQPVTWVSWFAARAYCASEGARLPRWTEWEYAASADAKQRDARDDHAWLARILAHLTTRSDGNDDMRDELDIYGLHDMHQLIGEWVDDYATLFFEADARNPGSSNLLSLCGGAAAAFVDRTDYALMMRVATLTALTPSDGSGTVGFRCVKDVPGKESI